jgi:hypothetical protein
VTAQRDEITVLKKRHSVIRKEVGRYKACKEMNKRKLKQADEETSGWVMGKYNSLGESGYIALWGIA